jgi:hypothetical protein
MPSVLSKYQSHHVLHCVINTLSYLPCSRRLGFSLGLRHSVLMTHGKSVNLLVCTLCYICVDYACLFNGITVMLQLMKDRPVVSLEDNGKFHIQCTLIPQEREITVLQDFVSLSSRIACSHHHVGPQMPKLALTQSEQVVATPRCCISPTRRTKC